MFGRHLRHQVCNLRLRAYLELKLKELTISKPFRTEYPSIDIIVQDFNLAIVLGIKDKSLIVISRIMPHNITHYRSQSFISLTHVGRSGLHKKLSSAIKVYHGCDILCSNSATTNKLLLFISICSPSGDFRIKVSTCQVVDFGATSFIVIGIKASCTSSCCFSPVEDSSSCTG